MKKKWLYSILSACFLISLLYDKQITLIIANNRIASINGFMIWLTNLLTIVIVFLLMTTLFLWEEKKRKWIMPLWMSVATAAIITMLMKLVISRTRPFEALTFSLLKGADYTFAAWNTSFPSLHAAAVFSLVPILDKEFPKLKWFWIILASLIAFSRIYIGVHYISDTLAGCLIGLSAGYGVIHLERKYKLFKRWEKKKN